MDRPKADIRYQHGNGTDSHPANLVRVERAGHSRYYHYEHSGWPHALTGTYKSNPNTSDNISGMVDALGYLDWLNKHGYNITMTVQ